MTIEYQTINNKKSELYHNVSKVSVKGDMIYLYYTDNKTYQEFLNRVSFKKLKFFNVLD